MCVSCGLPFIPRAPQLSEPGTPTDSMLAASIRCCVGSLAEHSQGRRGLARLLLCAGMTSHNNVSLRATEPPEPNGSSVQARTWVAGRWGSPPVAIPCRPKTDSTYKLTDSLSATRPVIEVSCYSKQASSQGGEPTWLPQSRAPVDCYSRQGLWCWLILISCVSMHRHRHAIGGASMLATVVAASYPALPGGDAGTGPGGVG